MADYMGTKEVAAALCTNHATVLEYAGRQDDPLPLRYLKGKWTGGFVIVEEFNDWLQRNTCFYNDRKCFRD